jgi:hypothetical protein
VSGSRIGLAATIGIGILVVGAVVLLQEQPTSSGPLPAQSGSAVEENVGDGEESTGQAEQRSPEPVRGQTAQSGAARRNAEEERAADEAAIMAKLHEVKLSNPPLSLRLAREGNQRFPDSPDAPERAWFEARALVDMQRFDEAQELARAMGKLYPGTHWTEDVQRHLNRLGAPRSRIRSLAR